MEKTNCILIFTLQGKMVLTRKFDCTQENALGKLQKLTKSDVKLEDFKLETSVEFDFYYFELTPEVLSVICENFEMQIETLHADYDHLKNDYEHLKNDHDRIFKKYTNLIIQQKEKEKLFSEPKQEPKIMQKKKNIKMLQKLKEVVSQSSSEETKTKSLDELMEKEIVILSKYIY